MQPEDRKRDLALVSLAIDSKLRGCDLVPIMVEDRYSLNPAAREPSVTPAGGYIHPGLQPTTPD